VRAASFERTVKDFLKDLWMNGGRFFERSLDEFLKDLWMNF
jgi:hypothetical protein